ncbi:hypothetical protein ACFVS9_28295 [Streptomyces sp. NPDC058008]|uniref:hypothetical protein n=1 Tax=Streptomyces sp. NPDC058008 TaxID=3346303 RepID=UPI0036EC0F8B
MNPTLTPSQFTSPDIRITGPAVLLATDDPHEDLNMRQVQEELAAALRHIDDLPRRYPYEDPDRPGKPL